MKHIHTCLATLAIAALACSCEKIIEFDGRTEKSKLALHCFLQSGEPVRLTLTTARFFLSNGEIQAVDKAGIQVFCNDKPVETLELTDCYLGEYSGNFCPSPGDRISITASAPGFETVDCSAVMPQPPVIPAVSHTDVIERHVNVHMSFSDGVDVIMDTTYYLDGQYYITCHISDYGNTSNYYRLPDGVQIKQYYRNGQTEVFEIPVHSNDIVFGIEESELFESAKNPCNIFSDDLFNGGEYRLKFDFSNFFVNSTDINGWNRYIKSRECNIRLLSITEAYYLYVRTILASESDNPFTEPVQIYSNINKGIGILAASTAAEYTISLPVK